MPAELCLTDISISGFDEDGFVDEDEVRNVAATACTESLKFLEFRDVQDTLSSSNVDFDIFSNMEPFSFE